MAVKITGKVAKVDTPRTVSVKLMPTTIAQLEKKAAALGCTRHALMRARLEAAAA